VLVDVPKDIQQQLDMPDWDAPMQISGYMSRLPPPPEPAQLAAVVKALKEAKKPVSVGGCGGVGVCGRWWREETVCLWGCERQHALTAPCVQQFCL
jgi:thiamine pyrophosphate-dependent acetolactate synthase large subunit-like protein